MTRCLTVGIQCYYVMRPVPTFIVACAPCRFCFKVDQPHRGPWPECDRRLRRRSPGEADAHHQLLRVGSQALA